MFEFAITLTELASETLTPEHRETAVRALRDDGFVVLKNAVDVAHTEILRERMLEDLEVILQRKDRPENFTAGHVQQDPPPVHPYLFRDVLLNPVVVDVTQALLGEGVTNSYYSGNTNLPGSPEQPVHTDQSQLWPDLEVAHPAYAVVVNIPLVDMDEANGSIELWPGTHGDTSMHRGQGTLRISEEVLVERRVASPPLQPRVECGSVLIRDMRLWHRGMPNRSNAPRPMIGMIHYCGWMKTQPMVFPMDVKDFFTGSALHNNVRFVDGPVEYLARHKAYDVRATAAAAR